MQVLTALKPCVGNVEVELSWRLGHSIIGCTIGAFVRITIVSTQEMHAVLARW